jgi:probable F420-dependent oxidoreductase
VAVAQPGRPMHAGAVLPVHLAAAGPGELVRYARRLESLGARHLTLFDHVLGSDLLDRDPPLRVAYDYRTPFREPLVLAAYLAASTTTLELATGVLALPQRQTALVAKQVAELTMLSGGRFRLGVGIGLNRVESEAMGAEYVTRGARQEEQIRLLRRFWTEDLVDFTGRFHRVDRAGIAPLPPEPTEVWLGGRSDAAVDRAVRLADGFVAVVHGPDDLRLVECIAAAALTAGRAGFGIEALVDYHQEPGGVSSLLPRLRELGVTHVTVRTDSLGPSLGSHEAAVGEFLANVRGI